ncbi:hypothetical protein Rhe02_82360 [Rhizocola hellebori]|uniref:Uncharacterized protein n=1 Tax=Rhizocola hellebori TaxID=1392758 RepID=A0A8J3QFS8_9ACTN|nr:hypothetical protein [Rhizocola hellebori]GIH10169.1 hypothetical protein Rhe02_82360 [Rhizocola hellebori]
MKKPGFFRRNMWGLLGLLPAIAAFTVVALDRTDFYGQQINGQPKAGVSAAPAEWVSYSKARLRLVNMAATTDLYDTAGKPLKMPADLKTWRAVIEIQVDNQKDLADCEISLEDSEGRLFGTRPYELANLKMPTPTCTAEDTALNAYQVTVFFIAPADAKPVAVRVVRAAALPGYARLVGA